VSELREKQRREHREKYELLAQKIGIAALLEILPKTAEAIHRALDEGDEHLNTWGNGPWDRAAGMRFGTWGDGGLISTRQEIWRAPFTPEKARGLSAAERVCALKHVAKYHTNYKPKEVSKDD
jgi:hypothetical protein